MQLLGKLKISKNKKFHNFSETTTDGAGNADKKTPGSARGRDQRCNKKGSPFSGEPLRCW
jgi:hypothetical protein